MKLLINKTQTNLMIIKYCNQRLKTFMSMKKPPNQVAFSVAKLKTLQRL